MADRTVVQLYENIVVLKRDSEAGSGSEEFVAHSGSRMLLTLRVSDIDVGAEISIDVEETFDHDEGFNFVGNFTADAEGFYKLEINNYNHLIRINFVVTGGSASFKVAAAIFDNATINASGVDAVKIWDGVGGEFLLVNPDGSVNVNVVSEGAVNSVITNTFGSAAAVSSGVLTTVVTYTVPALFESELFRIEASGQNIAIYEAYINATLIARKRTNHGTDLAITMEFGTALRGLAVVPGDVIRLRVLHNRVGSADFEARIQTVRTTV